MTVRPLRSDEVEAAAALAARAFFDDPLFQFVYPDPSRRLAGFAGEHAAYVRYVYAPYGVCEMAEADGALAGLALWLPPGAEVPAWREWTALPALVRGAGLRRLPAVRRAYRAFDDAMPDGRFWYLGLLAVDPEAQGRGVGSALVRAGLARADAGEVGTFLETGTATNVAFYRRLGFEVTGEIPLPGGPTHWAMWRAPDSTPDSLRV
ncbi:GNAT family N-acetyltransferase [Rubrivirga sp.]|uniref:GNAT family N-acetyltransferase n=1 Tax=Rubrivirga sp. TaxID=1885344 RepID=UPI003B529C92